LAAHLVFELRIPARVRVLASNWSIGSNLLLIFEIVQVLPELGALVVLIRFASAKPKSANFLPVREI
jgi:hypothetical protein